MDAAAVPTRRADCRTELVDHELLVYQPTSASAIYFNETAALVWHLCDGSHTVAVIVELLQDAYPDESDSIETDVIDTLTRMVEHGCIDVA